MTEIEFQKRLDAIWTRTARELMDAWELRNPAPVGSSDDEWKRWNNTRMSTTMQCNIRLQEVVSAVGWVYPFDREEMK